MGANQASTNSGSGETANQARGHSCLTFLSAAIPERSTALNILPTLFPLRPAAETLVDILIRSSVKCKESGRKCSESWCVRSFLRTRMSDKNVRAPCLLRHRCASQLPLLRLSSPTKVGVDDGQFFPDKNHNE